MTTTRTWIHYRMNGRILAGALGVSVRANSSLDSELWVRAEFEVPVMGTGDSGLIDHPAPPLQSLVLPEDPVEVRPGDEVTFETGALKHLRCRFYWVTVLVYEDRSGGNILGHHRQAIYSRLDGTRIRSDRELDEALASERHCAP